MSDLVDEFVAQDAKLDVEELEIPDESILDEEKKKEKQFMRGLVDALVAHDPELEIHNPEEMEAATYVMGEYIELDHPRWGIQISIYPDSAGVSMVDAHQGERAEAAFRKLFEYVDILQKKGGFKTWDTQTGKILDIGSDLPMVLEMNEHTLEELIEPEKKKPWWHFW